MLRNTKTEGHYTIKRVDKLPEKGNANWLYVIRASIIDRLYRWDAFDKEWEVIYINSQGFIPEDTVLNFDSNTNVLSITFTDGMTKSTVLDIKGYVTTYTDNTGLEKSKIGEYLNEDTAITEVFETNTDIRLEGNNIIYNREDNTETTVDLTPILDQALDVALASATYVESLSTIVLTLNNGQNISVTLTGLGGNSTPQNLSLIETSLSISDGNTVELSTFLLWKGGNGANSIQGAHNSGNNSGVESLILGSNNSTTQYSFVVGENNDTQSSSIIIGDNNIATFNSGVFGGSNTCGQSCLVSGFNNSGSDWTNMLGRNLHAPSDYETVIGLYSTDYTPLPNIGGTNTTVSNPDNRLFNVANGFNDFGAVTQSDAFTILKNAQVGIDIDNFEINTTGEKLQVNGLVRSNVNISDITNGSDKVLITKEYLSQSQSTSINSITAGDNITIDNTDPSVPVISSSLPVGFYEEGVYTPSFDTALSNYTSTFSSGSYTRIGNFVTLNVYFEGVVGDTGQIKIDLPYIASSSNSSDFFPQRSSELRAILNSNLTTEEVNEIRVVPQQNSILFLKVDSDTTSSVTDIIFNTNGKIEARVSYMTNVYV